MTARVKNFFITKRLAVSSLGGVISGRGIRRRRSYFDYNIFLRCDEAGRDYKMMANGVIRVIRILPLLYSRLGLYLFDDVSGDRATGDCSRINRRSVPCHVCLATRLMYQGRPPII